MKKIRILLISIIIAVSTGIFGFRFVSIENQASLLTDLLQISAILFAILGIWIAILDPTSILEKKPSSDLSSRSTLALDLIPPLILSTTALIITVLLKFITPILSVINAPSSYIPFFRSIYGIIITSIVIAEIWVIIATLLPIASVLIKNEIDRIKKDYRNRE